MLCDYLGQRFLTKCLRWQHFCTLGTAEAGVAGASEPGGGEEVGKGHRVGLEASVGTVAFPLVHWEPPQGLSKGVT